MIFINKRQTIFLLFVLAVFSSAIFSQTIVPDTKLEGLKGKVKTMETSGKAVSGYAEWVLKKEPDPKDLSSYSEDGFVTEKLNRSVESKVVFSIIDGEKTFKSFTIASQPSKQGFTAVFSAPEKPIEPNEKVTKPDERFDYKYLYEVSKDGTVITERGYKNTGELFRKQTLEFNSKGLLIGRVEENTSATMTYTYKYDDKGILIEENEKRVLKVPGSNSKSRTVYSNIKVDSKGNWTERKQTTFSETEAYKQYNIPAKKYELVSMSYREFTYYQ